MKVKCLLFIILFINYNCDQREYNVELLTNNTHKFWDFTYKGDRGAYLFDKNGLFNHYIYSAVDSSRFIFPLDDVVVSNTWELVGSDSLVINGDRYRIVQLTKDSLKIIHQGLWIDSFTCVTSPDQMLK